MSRLWKPESERILEDDFERNKNKVTCTAPIKPKAIKCPVCDHKVIVHCSECETPVTGCNCGLKKRVESVKDALVDRLYE